MTHNDDAYGRMMWDFHRGIPSEEIVEREGRIRRSLQHDAKSSSGLSQIESRAGQVLVSAQNSHSI